MEIQAYILAGGKSSRMGQDKGLIEHHGKALIQWVIDAVLPLNTSIKIIASSAHYNRFDFERLQDRTPGLGPAGGILTALMDASTDKVLVLPCDMPFVSTTWLSKLMDASKNMDVLISESTSGVEPLCGLYSSSIKHQWERLVSSGTLKLTDLIGHFRNGTLRIMDFPSENQDMFANINSPADLEKLKENTVLSLLVFGKLTDLLGGRTIEIPLVATVKELKACLLKRCPEIESTTYSVAVNREFVGDEFKIQPGSEVALMPPFSGG